MPKGSKKENSPIKASIKLNNSISAITTTVRIDESGVTHQYESEKIKPINNDYKFQSLSNEELIYCEKMTKLVCIHYEKSASEFGDFIRMGYESNNEPLYLEYQSKFRKYNDIYNEIIEEMERRINTWV